MRGDVRKEGIGVGENKMCWEYSLIDYSKILNKSIVFIGFFERQDRCVIWGVGKPEKTLS